MRLVVVAALLLQLAAGDAAACDRGRNPLDEPQVAAAVADVVAVVTITQVGGGGATANVVATLKGNVKPGDPLAIDKLIGVDEMISRCGAPPVAVGERYVVMLWKPAAGRPRYDLVETTTGIHPGTDRALIERAVAAKHPHTEWVESDGIQLQVVVDPGSEPGELGLVAVMRNTRATAAPLDYKTWPAAEHSHCTLDILDPDGKPVVAKEVPIAKADIADYFSKHGAKYRHDMPPGESHIVFLQRVTTARPGWGYKEELGFQYYPTTKRGPHQISATCTRFFGAGSKLATGPLTVTL